MDKLPRISKKQLKNCLRKRMSIKMLKNSMKCKKFWVRCKNFKNNK